MEELPRGFSKNPSNATEKRVGRFGPSPAAEVRGDITVHAHVGRLGQHLQRAGEVDDSEGHESVRAGMERARTEGHTIHQPRMTMAEGKPKIREGAETFKAARSAGAKVMPISVDRKSASKFHEAFGHGEPSLAIYHTELEEEAQGQPDR